MKSNGIIKPPCYELKINRAVFINQNIVLHPSRTIAPPKELKAAIEFLFGEGVTIIKDRIDGFPCIVVSEASYMLSNASTLNPDFVLVKEIKENG